MVTGVSGSQAAVCYVCRLPNVRGKFLPHKAASLGVQRGPLYGELQRGRSVQSANGRIVHPHEVGHQWTCFFSWQVLLALYLAGIGV